jgi:hypothetical protein
MRVSIAATLWVAAVSYAAAGESDTGTAWIGCNEAASEAQRPATRYTRQRDVRQISGAAT